RLLGMMKAPKSYDGMGWLYSSDRAALRKAMHLNMKELAPDLRTMVRDLTNRESRAIGPILCAPFVFAIHQLGGKISEIEFKSLRRHTYLLPLKKHRNGYVDDD
ncbi:MAG TPA: hypothetical protein VK661_11080, partial [Planctomycetota bacterium]|nr:hypothetical protein [Planctomycetota bacterium]